jgi:hypothetical protein
VQFLLSLPLVGLAVDASADEERTVRAVVLEGLHLGWWANPLPTHGGPAVFGERPIRM